MGERWVSTPVVRVRFPPGASRRVQLGLSKQKPKPCFFSTDKSRRWSTQRPFLSVQKTKLSKRHPKSYFFSADKSLRRGTPSPPCITPRDAVERMVVSSERRNEARVARMQNWGIEGGERTERSVAQLERAPDSESGGRRFDPCRSDRRTGHGQAPAREACPSNNLACITGS